MQNTRGDGLLSATALCGIALWLLNDHVLKQHSPGFLTGKLSDVASLIVLPIALQAGWELARPGAQLVPSRRLTALCCGLVGAFFVAMETSEIGSYAFRATLALLQWPFRSLHARTWLTPQLVQHWSDAEDLITLPALLLPYRLGLRRAQAAASPAPPAERSLALQSSTRRTR